MTQRSHIIVSALGACLACGTVNEPGTNDGNANGGSETHATGGVEPGTGGAQVASGGGESSGGTTPSGGQPNGHGSGGESASGGTVDNTGGTTSSGGATSAANGMPSDALSNLLDTRQPKITFFHGVFDAAASISLDPQLESPAADASCSWTFAGDCGYRKGCEREGVSSLDAGDVSLMSPGVEGIFSSSYEAGSYSADHSNFATRLSGEEGLQLSATGGEDLPAFDLDTEFPLLILVSSPPAHSAEPLPVPTTSDLVVEFTRGTAKTWLYAGATAGSGSEGRELLCAANGDPGTLSIPKQALEHIGPGVEIRLLTVSVASLLVESTEVHFWAATEATTEARAFAYKLATQ